MSVSALLAAAALTPASFGMAEARALVNGFGKIGKDDDAIADVEIVLQPDGHVRACKVLNGWGSRVTLEQLCPHIMRFAVKTIAKVDDEPAYGKFRTRLTVTESRPSQLPPRRPDYTLSVAAMPDGIAGPVDVLIVARVAADGTMMECSNFGGGGGPFVAAACRQLGQRPLQVLTDASGQPVSYITRVSMRFVGPDQAEDLGNQ